MCQKVTKKLSKKCQKLSRIVKKLSKSRRKKLSKSSQKIRSYWPHKNEKKIGQKLKTKNQSVGKFVRKAQRKTENTDYDECSASVDQMRLRRIW
jgi:hypothetical protein